MKIRFLSLFLTVAVLCSCMAVTVGASEIESGLLNLLDYSMPNGASGTYIYMQPGANRITFALPFRTSVRYLDMVVTAPADLASVYIVNGTSRTALTISKISTYDYRIFGTANVVNISDLVLEFNTASGGGLTFYSAHFSALTLATYAPPSVLILEDKSATQSGGNNMISLTAYPNAAFGNHVNWTSSIRCVDWQKYSYMSFTLSFYTHSLTNINVQIDGKPVPFTYNMIEQPSGFDYAFTDDSTEQPLYIYSVSVSIDLTGVQRTQTGDLIVSINGSGHTVTATLHHTTGYNPVDLPDADITWLQKIWKGLQDGFKSVVDAINGDTGSANDFQDEVTDKTDQLGDIGSAIDSVEKPDAYDPNVSGMENVGQLMAGGGLAYVIGSPYILPLFTASMGLCFASYALFGKKG